MLLDLLAGIGGVRVVAVLLTFIGAVLAIAGARVFGLSMLAAGLLCLWFLFRDRPTSHDPKQPPV